MKQLLYNLLIVATAFSFVFQTESFAQEDNYSKNKEEENTFLSTNKSVKGVKCSSSGLQYVIIDKGKGKKPHGVDEVYVKYKGYFADGSVFDSSLEKPAIFRMNAVITGMAEGLSMLGVGGKAILYVPSKLGYGEIGAAAIEPYKMLIFEIELCDIYNEYDYLE